MSLKMPMSLNVIFSLCAYVMDMCLRENSVYIQDGLFAYQILLLTEVEL